MSAPQSPTMEALEADLSASLRKLERLRRQLAAVNREIDTENTSLLAIELTLQGRLHDLLGMREAAVIGSHVFFIARNEVGSPRLSYRLIHERRKDGQ